MAWLNTIREALRGTMPHRVFRYFVPSSFVPPPTYEVKREIIIDHGRRHGLRVFVETGSFLGETVEACLPHFDTLHTIELAEPLYREVAARFAAEPKVTCHLGNSAERLRDLLPIHQPTLFWLDAHYSGEMERDGRTIRTARGNSDSPVAEELRVVLERMNGTDVILIDDAHAFDGEGGYPTISEVESLVRSYRSSAHVEVRDDIIRIYPAGRPLTEGT